MCSKGSRRGGTATTSPGSWGTSTTARWTSSCAGRGTPGTGGTRSTCSRAKGSPACTPRKPPPCRRAGRGGSFPFSPRGNSAPGRSRKSWGSKATGKWRPTWRQGGTPGTPTPGTTFPGAAAASRGERPPSPEQRNPAPRGLRHRRGRKLKGKFPAPTRAPWRGTCPFCASWRRTSRHCGPCWPVRQPAQMEASCPATPSRGASSRSRCT